MISVRFNPPGKNDHFFAHFYLAKNAQSEAKVVSRIFATNWPQICCFLARSFASRFLLCYVKAIKTEIQMDNNLEAFPTMINFW
jgi:hypothetical protein